MGKKCHSEFYKVRSIAGMKKDEGTGELLFLIKWSGFPKEFDTWEPLENLRTVEDMLRLYLRRRGLDPNSVLHTHQSSFSSEHSDPEDAEFVPYPVHSRRRKQKCLQSSITPFLSRQKIFKTEKVETFPNKALQQLSEFMSPVQKSKEPPSVIKEDEETVLFPGLRPRPGYLDYDRPVRIVGVRERENTLEYAILYRWNERETVGIGFAKHEEVMRKAPWLFAQFFQSTSKLVL